MRANRADYVRLGSFLPPFPHVVYACVIIELSGKYLLVRCAMDPWVWCVLSRLFHPDHTHGFSIPWTSQLPILLAIQIFCLFGVENWRGSERRLFLASHWTSQFPTLSAVSSFCLFGVEDPKRQWDRIAECSILIIHSSHRLWHPMQHLICLFSQQFEVSVYLPL